MLGGGLYVSTTLAERIALDLPKDGQRPIHETREFEILVMIGCGKTVSQTAKDLHLTVTTVSTYRARIPEKMDMTTTAELVRHALRNQLVD